MLLKSTRLEMTTNVRLSLGFCPSLAKKLSAAQITVLLSKKESVKPLYLVIACSELVVFGIFEELDAKIQQLSDTIPELLEQVLQRLEDDHGSETVRSTLCLIHLAKGGLLETELLALTKLPASKWSSLYLHLRPYLRPPGDKKKANSLSEGRIDFFHQQVPKAVRNYFLTKSDGSLDKAAVREFHSLLTEYFREKCDPRGDLTWSGMDPRPFRMLIHHMCLAEKLSDVSKVLCDLTFIQRRCEMSQAYDLLNDFQYALEIPQLPEMVKIDQFFRFVKQSGHHLNLYPSLTMQQAVNQPDTSAPAHTAASLISQKGAQNRIWCRWLTKPQNNDPCICTAHGHARDVFACVLSDDNRTLFSASGDSTVRIFDARTGAEDGVLRGHSKEVRCLSVSQLAKFSVSGSDDGTVRIWNNISKAQEKVIEGLASASSLSIISVSFLSSISRLLRHAFFPETTSLSDAALPESSLSKAIEKKDEVLPEFIVVGVDTRVVFVHTPALTDVFSASAIVLTVSGTAPVSAVAVATGGDILAVGYANGVVNVFDTVAYKNGNTGAFRSLQQVTDVLVRSLKFSNSGNLLLAANEDFSNQISMWKCENISIASQVNAAPYISEGICKSATISQNGQLIAIATSRGHVSVFTIGEAANGKVFSGHCPALCVSFSFDNRHLAVSYEDGTSKVFDCGADSGSASSETVFHPSFFYKSVFNPLAKTVSSCCLTFRNNGIEWFFDKKGDGKIEVSSVASFSVQNFIHDLDVHPISGLVFTTGTCVSALRITEKTPGDISTREQEAIWQRDVVDNSEGGVGCVKVSPDGRVVAASYKSELLILDLHSSAIFAMYGHKLTPTTLAFSPCGRFLFSGESDFSMPHWKFSASKFLIKKWGVYTGTHIADFEGHTAAITNVVVSPTGTHAASSSFDATIRVWNVLNGVCERVIPFAGAVMWVSFSESGKYLAAALEDHTVAVLPSFAPKSIDPSPSAASSSKAGVLETLERDNSGDTGVVVTARFILPHLPRTVHLHQGILYVGDASGQMHLAALENFEKEVPVCTAMKCAFPEDSHLSIRCFSCTNAFKAEEKLFTVVKPEKDLDKSFLGPKDPEFISIRCPHCSFSMNATKFALDNSRIKVKKNERVHTQLSDPFKFLRENSKNFIDEWDGRFIQEDYGGYPVSLFLTSLDGVKVRGYLYWPTLRHAISEFAGEYSNAELHVIEHTVLYGRIVQGGAYDGVFTDPSTVRGRFYYRGKSDGAWWMKRADHKCSRCGGLYKPIAVLSASGRGNTVCTASADGIHTPTLGYRWANHFPTDEDQ
eukprot:TRINITY_DN3241_c0_g1_i5.p1 TRINITY_DN3241_c0_g1~~TRINITY_DN3241_c0_g1_i5.p1  ORF type:complete len:1300 (+),score=318.35 TRINITY_DN3241_c0_g1_i5:1589-5488(+)